MINAQRIDNDTYFLYVKYTILVHFYRYFKIVTFLKLGAYYTVNENNADRRDLNDQLLYARRAEGYRAEHPHLLSGDTARAALSSVCACRDRNDHAHTIWLYLSF